MVFSALDLFDKRARGKSNGAKSFTSVFYVFIILLVFIGYLPAIDNNFIYWDDQYYVTDNVYINRPTWEHFKILLKKVISLNYHPVTMISLWLNSYFAGTDSAMPYIMTNLVLHTLTSLLVFRLFINMEVDDWISAFTAVIFAIHPMHVESVVWVSERKDVLYGLFFFSSLIYYHQYLKYNNLESWIASFTFFLLACLSKAMAVALVPCLFLMDFFKQKNLFSIKAMVPKLPFLVFGVLIGMIALDVQQGNDFHGILNNSNTDKALAINTSYSFFEKVSLAGNGLWFYISNFFVPVGMSPFHPYPKEINSWNHFIGIASIVLLYAGLLISYFKSRKYFFGLAFTLATIILVLQWIPVGSAMVADRYSYLPYIGLGFIVGHFLSNIRIRSRNIILPLVTFFSAVGLCIITYSQSDRWHDHATLFTQAVEKYLTDSNSRILLATGQWKQGQIKEAIGNIEFAINKLGLYTSDAFEKLATCYTDIGESTKALAYYNHSISLDSLNYVARYHRGILIINDDPIQAIMDFNICESSGFEFIIQNIYEPRAAALTFMGEYASAIEDYSKAIALGRNLALNYRDRALNYDRLGFTDLAENDRATVIKIIEEENAK